MGFEMTNKPDADKKLQLHDRRSGEDRRKVDKGFPGKYDRRRNLESRKPDVSEIDMSNTDWAALSDEPALPKK